MIVSLTGVSSVAQVLCFSCKTATSHLSVGKKYKHSVSTATAIKKCIHNGISCRIDYTAVSSLLLENLSERLKIKCT